VSVTIFIQSKSLKQAKKLRDEARLLNSGLLRDAVLGKARQIDSAANIEDWINSPGLQPPKKVTAGPF
jgi:hypothetical protein